MHLAKTNMKNEVNVNFFQNSPFGIQHIYSSKFSIGRKISGRIASFWVCKSYSREQFSIVETRLS